MSDVRVETVTTAVVPLVSWNPKRTSVSIFNDHAANILYIGFNPNVSSTTGFALPAKTGFTFDIGSGSDPRVSIWAIASAAATIVRILEEYGLNPFPAGA